METNKLPKSITGYSCPNYGEVCSEGPEGSLISRTSAIFSFDQDPSYNWEETHKCNNCGTVYTLSNGT